MGRRASKIKTNPCFNPCFFGSGVLRKDFVLFHEEGHCFNPCFFGSGVLRGTPAPDPAIPLGFNPCFFGSGVLRGRGVKILIVWKLVSILVFLEVGF